MNYRCYSKDAKLKQKLYNRVIGVRRINTISSELSSTKYKDIHKRSMESCLQTSMRQFTYRMYVNEICRCLLHGSALLHLHGGTKMCDNKCSANSISLSEKKTKNIILYTNILMNMVITIITIVVIIRVTTDCKYKFLFLMRY